MWFGSIFAIQEDSEELEEPKQVVYKENDVGTKLSDGSENSNDSEESKIEGTRNNLLEKNGLYPSLHFSIFVVHLMPLKYSTMMLLSDFFFFNCDQVSEFDHDETQDQEDQQKGLSSTDETQDLESQQKILASKDDTQDQEAQHKGLSSTERDQVWINSFEFLPL